MEGREEEKVKKSCTGQVTALEKRWGQLGLTLYHIILIIV